LPIFYQLISEHLGGNRVIPVQAVAKWRCSKPCAIFFWTTLYKDLPRN